MSFPGRLINDIIYSPASHRSNVNFIYKCAYIHKYKHQEEKKCISVAVAKRFKQKTKKFAHETIQMFVQIYTYTLVNRELLYKAYIRRPEV